MAGVVIFLGPTGAGKSSQAKKLAERKGWGYLNSGDLLRGTGDRHLLEHLNAGNLAPSEIIEKLLQDALEREPADRTLVLDGFPRLKDEMGWLIGYLPTVGREVLRVIEVSVPPEVSFERLTYRDRSDDDRKAIENKLEWYREETGPVLADFKARNLLHVIDGRPDPETVYRSVEAAI